ncbi:MAG: prepilin-type N-terminal cleavage/methylation domain-containing protein [Planctomycetota bacterium]
MQTRLPAVRPGFTLMEILIVVVILGILAAIVIPSFASATEDTRKAAFAQDIRAFETGILRYEIDFGEFPPDGGSGTVPLGLEDYVNVPKWQSGSPIGGVWDNETDDVLTAGMGVHFDGTGQTRDASYMADIDLMIDDGEVTTGSFRNFGDRYYRVIVP